MKPINSIPLSEKYHILASDLDNIRSIVDYLKDDGMSCVSVVKLEENTFEVRAINCGHIRDILFDVSSYPKVMDYINVT